MVGGGMLPQAYVYPAGMRATRDLLRRRTRLVRTRAEALAHIQNTLSQYNLPPIGKKLSFAANRVGVAERPRTFVAQRRGDVAGGAAPGDVDAIRPS